MATSLFFTGLVPPARIREGIRRLQEEAWEMFGSKHALRSPPHITLVPPHRVTTHLVSDLVAVHKEVVRDISPFSQVLDGIGAFAPRVIFVQPKNSPKLQHLRDQLLKAHAKTFPDATADKRPFHPHISLAFRDLRRSEFSRAFAYFRDKGYSAEWEVARLVLLQHGKGGWEIFQEFQFAGNSGEVSKSFIE